MSAAALAKAKVPLPCPCARCGYSVFMSIEQAAGLMPGWLGGDANMEGPHSWLWLEGAPTPPGGRFGLEGKGVLPTPTSRLSPSREITWEMLVAGW